jgi:hypothetical protein
MRGAAAERVRAPVEREASLKEAAAAAADVAAVAQPITAVEISGAAASRPTLMLHASAD